MAQTGGKIYKSPVCGGKGAKSTLIDGDYGCLNGRNGTKSLLRDMNFLDCRGTGLEHMNQELKLAFRNAQQGYVAQK